MFTREKKIDCGNYREVDIINRTDNAELAAKGKRRGRQKVSPPKQQHLNDKYARRYLVQLGNGNFGRGDYHITCTYAMLPDSVEAAEKKAQRYLARIAYRRMVMGLEPLKYILVTEYKFAKDGTTIRRIHHHIIVNGGIDRDILEMMWTEERICWRKVDNPEYRESIKKTGWCNVDRIQPNANGIEALCKYLVKDPQGKKRWSSSRNLIRPELHGPVDKKYRPRQIENVVKSPDGGRGFFEKQYPLYNITDIEAVYYDDTGWHVYLKMWRKKPLKKHQKKVGHGRKKPRKPKRSFSPGMEH